MDLRFLPAALAVLELLPGCGHPATPPSPCPPDMAYVSGGAFLNGADPEELDLAPLGYKLGFTPLPLHFVEVGEFCMDRFEYPNRLLAIPRASITLVEAREACRAMGKRLCTEGEFARACAGLDSWHYPYASTYRAGRCNSDVVQDVGSDRWVAESGTFTDCVSPEGVYDLEGNLSEWVDPDLGPDPLPPLEPDAAAHRRSPEPVELEIDPASDGVVRGGTMWTAIYGAGCHARHLHPSFGPTSNDDGFRCCMEVPRPKSSPSAQEPR